MSNPHFTLFAGTSFAIDITYYALCIMAGIVLCTIACYFLFKRRGLSADFILELLLILLPLGIIGARTFYVLTDPNTSMSEWFNFRDGGISILGAVLGGSLGVLLFALIRKINFLRLTDCIVPGLILAQGVGRWGNFVNQEVYGQLVTNPNLQFFPYAVFIEAKGQWYQALFFYEFLFNILLFAALYTFLWLYRKKPNGIATAAYFLGYGVVRSFMEGMRDKEFILGNAIAASRLVSILMAVGGALLLAFVLWQNFRKEGSLFGSKKGEPLAILPKYPLPKAEQGANDGKNLKQLQTVTSGQESGDKQLQTVAGGQGDNVDKQLRTATSGQGDNVDKQLQTATSGQGNVDKQLQTATSGQGDNVDKQQAQNKQQVAQTTQEHLPKKDS